MHTHTDIYIFIYIKMCVCTFDSYMNHTQSSTKMPCQLKSSSKAVISEWKLSPFNGWCIWATIDMQRHLVCCSVKNLSVLSKALTTHLLCCFSTWLRCHQHQSKGKWGEKVLLWWRDRFLPVLCWVWERSVMSLSCGWHDTVRQKVTIVNSVSATVHNLSGLWDKRSSPR